MSQAYSKSGVNLENADKVGPILSKIAAKTTLPGVLGNIGGFGGMFMPDMSKYRNPVLVSATDGVGTKLIVASKYGKYKGLGQDLVGMNVNDILTLGAEPLFFLDYLSVGKLDLEFLKEIASGIADACVESGCALIGGETAEMPDLYQPGDFDLAGFTVGIVDRDKIINGSDIKPNDIIVGLPSSGVHSNGFSLARKALFDNAGLSVFDDSGYDGKTIGDLLIEPTRLYVKSIQSMLAKVQPKGMVHITGGGFYGNLPRILPEGLGIQMRKPQSIPPIFSLIGKYAEADEKEMYSVFNMGIGFAIIVSDADLNSCISSLSASGEEPVVLGKVIDTQGVYIEGIDPLPDNKIG